MSTLEEERALVDRIADEMLEKLSENASRPHWRTSSVDFLLGRLGEEVRELLEAVLQARVSGTALDRAAVWEEAADVANFAAMIADVVTVSPFDVKAEPLPLDTEASS